MIARCFQHVNYPILPTVKNAQQENVSLRERNYRLFTPSDFDYSPYFEIIKYPAWNFSEQPAYRNLPWQNDAVQTDTSATIAKEAGNKHNDSDGLPVAGAGTAI